MDDVKRYGDSAIIKYTKKLDGVQLKTLKVTTEEIKQAYTLVSKGQIRSIVIMKKDLAKSERVLLSRLNGMVISSNGIKFFQFPASAVISQVEKHTILVL